MSGRRSNVLDIRESLRLMRLGESDRAIATGMKISRKTAKKYRVWAEEMGLTQGLLPAADTLNALLQSSLPDAPPPKTESSVEPYRELVVRWLSLPGGNADERCTQWRD